ncbi:hypothetical protein OG204_31995 [Streptomyces sp. NBC_01387]|uniref:hypothetical protein n=1 Tax=unclassified Streptomyces TaxID=2593676 RepID=UPI0022535C92|nr:MULTISPECIES: hypothetical protein [unclassified Streptomyces]MCX4553827.1 hypothetical protein [Streptomyces sp. NBC_01500]WSC18741.1 hypothetical protein OIE60_03210 [Streptomyces sp. NBC_01766]
MRSASTRVRVGLLATSTALASFISVGTATAAGAPTELNGSWASFTRCPVDDPTMLAADGQDNTALCVSSHSAGGSIKLGSSVVPTGASDLQLGVVTHANGTSTLVSPAGGALVADPAQLPGGLLGLMCPSGIPVVSSICQQITDSTLNKVTATIQSVNSPSDFQLLAGTTTGKPIVSLPVRIHLENPFLGSNCYIGSASNPIVLRPQNLTRPTAGAEQFAGDGTPDPAGPLGRINLVGADQGDSTYSVPGANGCGAGLLDWAVNLKTGLPSASGNNSVVLNNASTYVATVNDPSAVAPDEGKVLAQYWHSAVK